MKYSSDTFSCENLFLAENFYSSSNMNIYEIFLRVSLLFASYFTLSEFTYSEKSADLCLLKYVSTRNSSINHRSSSYLLISSLNCL